MGVVERIPAENDEGKLRDDTARAAQAQQVLDNPLVQEAFEHLEGAYTRRMKTAPTAEDCGKVYEEYQAFNGFRKMFTSIVTQGKQAALEIEQKKNPAKAHRLNTP